MTGRKRILDQTGFMLVQVVGMSAVLLLMIFAGYKTVRTTIQVTNTSATSASFQDLIRKIELNLTGTETCLGRLVNPLIAGAVLDNLLASPDNKQATTIHGPGGVTFASVETDPPTPGMVNRSREYKITEIDLTGFRRVGRSYAEVSAAGGAQPFENYTGFLSIAAEKRSEFLGGATMRTNIPVLFLVDNNSAPHQLIRCTTRSLYMVQLGPLDPPNGPGLPAGIRRKSGMECFDRGGTPVPVGPAGATWYYCAIPETALLNCRSINYLYPNSSGAEQNPEGWHCDDGASGNPKVAYAY